jgi:hypothetical protein
VTGLGALVVWVLFGAVGVGRTAPCRAGESVEAAPVGADADGAGDRCAEMTGVDGLGADGLRVDRTDDEAAGLDDGATDVTGAGDGIVVSGAASAWEIACGAGLVSLPDTALPDTAPDPMATTITAQPETTATAAPVLSIRPRPMGPL